MLYTLVKLIVIYESCSCNNFVFFYSLLLLAYKTFIEHQHWFFRYVLQFQLGNTKWGTPHKNTTLKTDSPSLVLIN